MPSHCESVYSVLGVLELLPMSSAYSNGKCILGQSLNGLTYSYADTFADDIYLNEDKIICTPSYNDIIDPKGIGHALFKSMHKYYHRVAQVSR